MGEISAFKNPLMPLCMFKHSCDDENDTVIIKPQHHRDFKFITVNKGQLNLCAGEKTYTAYKGDALFIPPNLSHTGISKFCDVTEIFFSDDILSSDDADEINTKYILPFFNGTIKDIIAFKRNANHGDTVINLISKIISEYSNMDIGSELIIKSLICRVWAVIIRELNLTKSNKKNDLLSLVLTYIKTNCKSDIDRKSISEFVGITEDYLNELLRINLKTTPMAYRNKCRLRECAAMLISTDKPISDIAAECGFKSIRTFNNQFIKGIGVTPYNYRKSSKLYQGIYKP